MKVRGAQSSGAALVSFNAPAFCSFGKEQNLNAPVGKYAAFAYTAALNRLVDDREHNKLFGDTTVVYWAEGGESVYQDFFGMSLDGSDEVTDKDLDEIMKSSPKASLATGTVFRSIRGTGFTYSVWLRTRLGFRSDSL